MVELSIFHGYVSHNQILGLDFSEVPSGYFIDGLPIKNGDFPWQTVSHNQMVISRWNFDRAAHPSHPSEIPWIGIHPAERSSVPRPGRSGSHRENQEKTRGKWWLKQNFTNKLWGFGWIWIDFGDLMEVIAGWWLLSWFIWFITWLTRVSGG